MRAHSFLNFIFLVIREKDELYILSLDLYSKTYKPAMAVYHPVSSLSHHYIYFSSYKQK